MKKKCYIVCGGPSLAGKPLGWLRKEDTIAVNYAVLHVPEPTYFVTADSGVIRNSVAADFWNLTDKTKKVVVINKIHPRYRNVRDLLASFDEHIEQTTSEGDIGLQNDGVFATGKNTGFAALQYAVKLGYKEIYLLGIDLAKKAGKKYFYDDGVMGDSPYDLFYRHFVTALRRLKGRVNVYSCSPVSRLNEHLPYVPYEKLVPKMPLFVSHYTTDTPYQDIVKNLVASLKKWNLDYEIEAIESLGSWRANSNYCAWQVQKMLTRYAPRSILRLDADAVVQRYPELFVKKKFRCDLAAAIWEQSKLRPDGELMGGTMYFASNERTKLIVDAWVRMCEKRPNGRNSDLLHGVIRSKAKSVGLKFGRLPLAYCKIFDFVMGGVKEPVIEHFQASRKCKAIINKKHPKK